MMRTTFIRAVIHIFLSECLYFHQNLHGQIGWITGGSILAPTCISLSNWWRWSGICSNSSLYHQFRKGI